MSGISGFFSLLSRSGSQKLIRNCDPYGNVASPTDLPLLKFATFLKSLVNPIPNNESELSSMDVYHFLVNALVCIYIPIPCVLVDHSVKILVCP